MPKPETCSLREHFVFLRTALKAPRQTGAIAPSSSSLARTMLAELPTGAPIVEIGPGTGSITRMLPPSANYLGVEASPHFVRHLRRRFPERRFLSSRIEDAHDEVRDFIGEQGVILSGLPFSSLPVRARQQVFDTLHYLQARTVVFRTFQYIHSLWMPGSRMARESLGQVYACDPHCTTVIGNLPPAVVLSWTSEREVELEPEPEPEPVHA